MKSNGWLTHLNLSCKLKPSRYFSLYTVLTYMIRSGVLASCYFS
jgi:hypothetical protein